VPLVACGPHEASTLQSLREETQPVTVIPQYFDEIAELSAKHEHFPENELCSSLVVANAEDSPSRVSTSIGDLSMCKNKLKL